MQFSAEKCEIISMGARHQVREYILSGNFIQYADEEKNLEAIVNK